MDKQFVELNDATVVAQVARPGGTTLNVPLQWTGERDGQYRGTFVSAEAGRVRGDRRRDARGGEAVGSRRRLRARRRRATRSTSIRRCTRRRCGASPRRPAAGSTRPTPSPGLAEDVRYAGRGVTSVEERELWNMPIILIALMGLVCAEWGYRRLVGSEPDAASAFPAHRRRPGRRSRARQDVSQVGQRRWRRRPSGSAWRPSAWSISSTSRPRATSG